MSDIEREIIAAALAALDTLSKADHGTDTCPDRYNPEACPVCRLATATRAKRDQDAAIASQQTYYDGLMPPYRDTDLVYAAYARCPCGAGLAYKRGVRINTPDACWDCSDILTGRAIPSVVQHTARLPFAFYEVKSEGQPSANGATTRPKPGDDH